MLENRSVPLGTPLIYHSGRGTIRRMKLLERITLEPDKCGGRPCIRGLRIRVTDILGMLADGMSHDEIDPLTEYARYILTSGTYADQGKLIEGIKSQFVIRNRTLEQQ